MPTFKHPCPHCGTYIARDTVACPKCGTADPFAPARCTNCRTVIEDPSYVACPRCGKPVGAAAVAAAEAEARAKAGAQPGADAPAPGVRSCAACSSPLPAGAGFCRECGTPVAPA
jgi:RNA polymerase subunit RPABC4/transcription elongation factor Spt4